MATYYSQEFPLGSPTVSGNSITVDLMLKEPTRINAYLSNIAQQVHFPERVFQNGGGFAGCALVKKKLTSYPLLPTRGVEKLASR
ncbi:hypothetical protein, partial [Klebsiella pneumoniae]|uniref:hypothetical protein n=1 Tax=Klebsiella pneumoniae TaxID=573 RepID=UPI001F4B4BFA